MPRNTSIKRLPERDAGRETLFNDGWRFYRGDAPHAQIVPFDDSTWREQQLPHDWSIEDLPPLVAPDTELIDTVPGQWHFQKGDDPAWAADSIDESGWETVTLPGIWEEHSNYTDDNVYGWFRRTIRIDSQCKGRKIALGLGQIDDVDETFFNGVRIGGRGTFPPDYHSAYGDVRIYNVPEELIRFDSENTVAVRVFDGPGNGGIYSRTPVHTRGGPFDSTASGGSGTGYTVGGTAWYRKTFTMRSPADNARVMLRFDGVYMNAGVWLNGKVVTSHAYGYSSFWCDITPHLIGGANVLAIQVRNAGANARWYSGSGIYRHVWLCTMPAVHVAPWGVYVTTPRVSRAAATLRVRTTVRNDSDASAAVTLVTTVIDPDGRAVTSGTTRSRIGANATFEFDQNHTVKNPQRWDTQTPHLYTVRTEVRSRAATDSITTPFGIRSISFDPARGFRLNGRSLKLKGACMHHDNGCLGACAFDRAEERRVQIMKANGYNALRMSHNPPSAAFLDTCDRLGMLVIDEAFDVWYREKRPDDYSKSFPFCWPADLDSMVLRDRNHPSVIMWSIGNELPEQSERLGVDIARMLSTHVRELDPTRPVNAAQCFGHIWESLDPMFAELDIGGYNYQLDKYESDHARVPSRIMVATETFPSQAFDYWQAVLKHPYLVGDFVWTGYDYLGEAGIGWGGGWANTNWPWTVAYCGDIDLCGYKKPQSYFRDMLWDSKPRAHIVVKAPEFSFGCAPSEGRWEWEDVVESWNWEGREGQVMEVRVYSNCDRVRLLLDGAEVANHKVSRCVAVFKVPYRPGHLQAVGIVGRHEKAVAGLRTTGAPVSIRLSADRTSLRADGYDLCFVTVELVDTDGNLVVNSDRTVDFSLTGPALLAGVGSGNPVSTESFQQPRRTTWRGRCQAVIRTTQNAGEVVLAAHSEGLDTAQVRVKSLIEGSLP